MIKRRRGIIKLQTMVSAIGLVPYQKQTLPEQSARKNVFPDAIPGQWQIDETLPYRC